MADMTSAMPLSAATTYAGSEGTITWDQNKIYGCVCDSTWTVGASSGQTQEPEYFGPGCELSKSAPCSPSQTASSFAFRLLVAFSLRLFAYCL
jgi:hypothetical protein